MATNHTIPNDIVKTRKGAEEVSRLIRQIELNPFMEFPDCNEFAESAGISPAQLSDLFKQLTGLPPYRFYTHVRLEYAKTLIEKGMSINIISSMFGYSHPIKFIQTFKKYHGGKTPGHYKGSASSGKVGNHKTYQNKANPHSELV